jgi:hypothetical protein
MEKEGLWVPELHYAVSTKLSNFVSNTNDSHPVCFDHNITYMYMPATTAVSFEQHASSHPFVRSRAMSKMPASHAFVAKKGKLRKVQKKPMSEKTKSYQNVPYVHGHRDLPARGTRMEGASWKRTLPELLSATDSQIVKILEEDGLLPKWHGKMCPHWWKGTLKCTAPQYRCTGNKCGKFVVPHHLHPLFTVSKGYTYKPLQLQAALFGVKTTSARLLFGVNHKMTERLSQRLYTLRRLHVEKAEKEIAFGGARTWQDVEADEATLRAKQSQAMVISVS